MRWSAGPSGVVLATNRGVQWTDWALRPTAVWCTESRPAALGVGPQGDSALVAVIDRTPMLVGFDPEGGERFRVELPYSRGAYTDHVMVDEAGRIIVSPPGALLGFDSDGTRRWAFERTGSTPALPLADGHALFEHGVGLWLVDRDGALTRLWEAPAPVRTAPVAGNDRFHVATDDALYELG